MVKNNRKKNWEEKASNQNTLFSNESSDENIFFEIDKLFF